MKKTEKTIGNQKTNVNTIGKTEKTIGNQKTVVNTIGNRKKLKTTPEGALQELPNAENTIKTNGFLTFS